MENVGRGNQRPWVIIGDFNAVLNIDDRVGGNPVSLAEVVDFQECVKVCGWIELPHQGSEYTWNDKQGDNKAFSKIDWVFINNEWLNQMPDFNATFLIEGISDHSLMKIAQISTPRRARRPFKYCNM